MTEQELIEKLMLTDEELKNLGFGGMEPARSLAMMLINAQLNKCLQRLCYLKEDKLPEYDLKLKKNYHGDGRLYEILLYCEPNSGHGWKPIARFYPEFTDTEENAERIVRLWNGCRLRSTNRG